MRLIYSFDINHFGLGIRYTNWAPKHHVLFIDVLWLNISINFL